MYILILSVDADADPSHSLMCVSEFGMYVRRLESHTTMWTWEADPSSTTLVVRPRPDARAASGEAGQNKLNH